MPHAPSTPEATTPADCEAEWSAAAAAGSATFEDTGDSQPTGVPPANRIDDGVTLRITRVVDDASRNFNARPSPDGTLVAFDSDRDGRRGVYVAKADGTEVRRVSGDGFAAVPAWSPDGRQLAFLRAEPDRSRVWNLWAVSLESGEMRRLTTQGADPRGASWFPDGRRLAYSRGDRLIVFDAVTGRERTYHSPRRGRPVRTPAVRPTAGG